MRGTGLCLGFSDAAGSCGVAGEPWLDGAEALPARVLWGHGGLAGRAPVRLRSWCDVRAPARRGRRAFAWAALRWLRTGTRAGTRGRPAVRLGVACLARTVHPRTCSGTWWETLPGRRCVEFCAPPVFSYYGTWFSPWVQSRSSLCYAKEEKYKPFTSNDFSACCPGMGGVVS